MKRFDDLILRQVMNGFPFEKIHAIMVLTDHRWVDPDNDTGSRVPTLKELKKAVKKRLLKELQKSDILRIDSLGFSAWIENEECCQTVRLSYTRYDYSIII